VEKATLLTGSAYKKQPMEKQKACFFQLRRRRQIRCLLGRDITVSLLSTFILSRLDYCNELLAGLPQSTMAPLQRVMNAAVRLVCNLRSWDHVTLRELHWLPIAARGQYKLCLHSAVVSTETCYIRYLNACPSRHFDRPPTTKCSSHALGSSPANVRLALPLRERGTVFLPIYAQQ